MKANVESVLHHTISGKCQDLTVREYDDGRINILVKCHSGCVCFISDRSAINLYDLLSEVLNKEGK